MHTTMAVAAATVGGALVAALGVQLYRTYSRMREPMSGKEFKTFKLVERHALSPQVRLLVFEVPFGKSLNLPTGKHIQLTFYDEHGQQVLRSYTPTETSVPGRFDLLMKVYSGGKMGTHLDELRVGDRVRARGPTGRVSYSPGQFAVGDKVIRCAHILMIAGGTGITPMMQIVKAVLRNSGSDRTQVLLIYASSNPSEVLLLHELAGFAEKHPTQFKLVLTVSRPTSEWEAKANAHDTPVAYETGRVTNSMLVRYAPKFIRQRPFPEYAVAGYCGPPSFEGAAKEVLEKLGYRQPSVNLFRW
ncbi:hypothetical protein T492DRAFT_938046 [Pavlovales sp. CCMP2436]|nr:hypothetical protein T492DRAFT_938046 [Pavlovales sp. CCMP2436]|mmetsp:Transcript_9781/g.24615  ORF Transcript_9781/g.24615 Transcript_9781/m.24615 type:complete len:302 (+) Transcript_9781:106-1011(+)